MKAKELNELPSKCRENPFVWTVGQKIVESIGENKSIKAISRITDGRGGTIYVSGTAYDASGRQRGGDIWYGSHISPATDADYKELAGSVSKARLSRFRWGNLPDEVAVDAIKLLSEKYPKMDFKTGKYQEGKQV